MTFNRSIRKGAGENNQGEKIGESDYLSTPANDKSSSLFEEYKCQGT